MAKRKRSTKVKTLAHGRPHLVKPLRSMSSRATRALIRTHHTLEKQLAKALGAGDTATASKLSEEIAKHGGIKMYQRASLLGQAKDRGGDSSKVLMEWLNTTNPETKLGNRAAEKEETRLRMLEVGALSTTNACSKSELFEIERIDLNSQSEGILQQDFMERPLPDEPAEQFDIISLSLVLNYVADANTRGEMLHRCLRFLRSHSPAGLNYLRDSFPSLFLVLPVSCVTNSRYLDEKRLEDIMQSMGYSKVHQKLSNKLAYYLWRATNLTPRKRVQSFKKVEVRAGKSRNNFSIVLK